jgi:hypothetical protein
LVFVTLARLAGPRLATKYTAITCLTFLVITLPFFLYDPDGFSPLHTTDELGRFEVVLPHAGLLIPLATAAVSVALALYRPAWPRDPGPKTAGQAATIGAPADLTTALLRNSALVLAFPVLCGIALYSIGLKMLHGVNMIYFGFASFGVFFLFFGAVPSWKALYPAVRSEQAILPAEERSRHGEG